MTPETKESELDEAVAVEVMGWKQIPYDRMEWGWLSKRVKKYVTPDGTRDLGIQHYSSEIDSAFEVVEAMRKMNCHVCIIARNDREVWDVDMSFEPNMLTFDADESLPLAISRCALAAVRARKEQPCPKE
jgi:hypothetical protein